MNLSPAYLAARLIQALSMTIDILEAMARLGDVFGVLRQMVADGVLETYAIGGGMAFLFYVEPTRTYDLDVFVLLPEAESLLVSLEPIYAWTSEHGFEVRAEHVDIHGVPVQFLPAYNDLVEEAVRSARVLDYDGIEVRVTSPEHLAALAIQTGGRKRRERAGMLVDAKLLDQEKLADTLRRHGLTEAWARMMEQDDGDGQTHA